MCTGKVGQQLETGEVSDPNLRGGRHKDDEGAIRIEMPSKGNYLMREGRRP